MHPIRRFIQGITLAVAGAIALVVMLRSPDFAHGQQLGEGMSRFGIVGIQNETEKKLFWSLLCTCGCPRETLGTCTCGFAHARRDELRAMLAEGKSMEEIQTIYVARYGPEALAVPPNKGFSRALYLVPIGAIIVGAGLVITTLRRWKRRSDQQKSKAGQDTSGAAAEAAHDDYDDKLDEELRKLDRE